MGREANFTQNFNINISGDSEIQQLKAQTHALQSEIDSVNSELQYTIRLLEDAQDELYKFKSGSGIDVLEEELRRHVESAHQQMSEFQTWLQSVQLTDGWGTNDDMFSGYFDAIKDGSMTAMQAITKVKTEWAGLMEENYNSNGGLFDSQMVASFTASIEQMGRVLEGVVAKINNIEQNGVKTLGDAGGSASGGGLGSLTDILGQLQRATEGMSEEAKAAYEPITNLVRAIADYGNLDTQKLLGISQAFRNIADIGKGSYGSKSIDNLKGFIQELQIINQNGGVGVIRFDATGFNELKVSKASLSNLATYLPQIAAVNVSKLERISKIDFTNLNNIKVSKSSAENIAKLTEAVALIKEYDKVINGGSGGGSGGSGGSSGGSSGGKSAKGDKDAYQDATRAVKEYYAARKLLDKTDNDVMLTSEGYVSQSGKWSELASTLNRTVTAYNAVTQANEDSNLSAEQQAAIIKLNTTESQKYASAVEQNANKQVSAIEKVEAAKARAALDVQYPEFNINANSLSSAYSKMINGGYAADSTERSAVTSLYSELLQKIEEVRAKGASASADEIANIQKETQALLSQITTINEKAQAQQKAADEAAKAAEREAQAIEKATSALDVQYPEFNINAKSLSSAYSKMINGGYTGSEVDSLTAEYRNVLAVIEAVRAASNSASADEVADIQKTVQALTEKIDIYNKLLSSEALMEENFKSYSSTRDENKMTGVLVTVYTEKVEKARAALEGLRAAGANATQVEKEGAQRAINEANKLYEALMKVSGSYDGIAAKSSSISALSNKINSLLNNNSRLSGTSYETSLNNILTELSNGMPVTEQRFRELRSEVSSIENSFKSAGLQGKSFFSVLQSGYKKFGGWALITKSMMAAVNSIRQMITHVVELDDAMTELKKVTDESDATYDNFFANATERAKSLGATVSDTINATADFSRLGYSIADASELADVAITYKNVGDGIEDISTASESIISTLQGFKLEAEDATHVIDAFNEVGNNFAVSSAGIGEAMTRAASSLYTANNTMEESIALITAMNTSLQDPEKVGKRLCPAA